MKLKTLAVLAVSGLAASAASAGIAGGPILLLVDNTDPSNVVISATGSPAGTVASIGPVSGVTLMGLFGGVGIDLPIGNIIAGNLSSNGTPSFFNRAGNAFGSLADNDLNIWISGGSGTQNFNTTDPAFSGATNPIDYSAASSFNLSGDIRLGDTPTGTIIGQWALIPTPGTAGVFALAGFAAIRRRRA